MSVPSVKIKVERSALPSPSSDESINNADQRSALTLNKRASPEQVPPSFRQWTPEALKNEAFTNASSAGYTTSRDPCSEPELKRRRISTEHGETSSESYDHITVIAQRSIASASALLQCPFFELQKARATRLDLKGISEAPIPSHIFRKIFDAIEHPGQIPELHRVSKALYRDIDSAYPLRRTSGLINDLCMTLGVEDGVKAGQFDSAFSMLKIPGEGYDIALLTPLGDRTRNLGLLMLLHWASGLAPMVRELRVCKVMESLRPLDVPDLAIALRDFAAVIERLPVFPSGSRCLIPSMAGHIRSLPESLARTDMLRTLLLLVAHAEDDDQWTQRLLNLASPALKIELSLYAVTRQSLFAISPGWRGVFGRPLPAQTASLTGNPDIIISQLDALTVANRAKTLLDIATLLAQQLSDQGEVDKYHPFGDHPITLWPRIPAAGICPALEVMRTGSKSLPHDEHKEMLNRLAGLLAQHFALPRPVPISDAQYVQCITEGLKTDSRNWQADLRLHQHWHAWPETGFMSSFEPRMKSEAYLLRELANDARMLNDASAMRSIHQTLQKASMQVPDGNARSLLMACLIQEEQKPEPPIALALDESFGEPWSLSPFRNS